MARIASSFELTTRSFSTCNRMVQRGALPRFSPLSRAEIRPMQSARPSNGRSIHNMLKTTRASSSPASQQRLYYTDSSPPEPPYPPTETAILAAATAHVPVHGFTTHSLTLGAIDAGYLPASVNLFPQGAFDLVHYHLITSRLGLKDAVQFPEDSGQTAPSTADKVRALLVSRLRANEAVIHKLPEALALMALPTNVPPSLRELALLVDEVLYLSGDTDVSASWYTKRAALAGVFASSELFMTQDQSKGFVETERFLDRRLEDSENAAYVTGSVGQWIGFTGISAVNVLRSWGAKI